MTSSYKVEDLESAQSGGFESEATNLISDFSTPKSTLKRNDDESIEPKILDIFICNFIFYIIFYYSLLLHIIIDLGLGSFTRKKVISLIKIIITIDRQ
tara:strand:- start:408 stop:701 length:294 start_codon:yes stop_codon:yes gene_type:complete